MGNLPFLSLVTFLPLLGAAFIMVIRGAPDVIARNARNVALLTSCATFLLSLGIWFNFDPTTADFQFQRLSSVSAGCRQKDHSTWATVMRHTRCGWTRRSACLATGGRAPA